MAQIVTVYLDDRNQDYDEAYNRFIDAGLWAQDHCASFVTYSIVDVSDHTLLFDQVAEYAFRDEQDATLFSLKWKQ
jgi:hypothetical protein